ncbi:MAG TPA: hypothetical protein VFP91_19865, partial [Vicinamibacterales bacterium]|nr:hypothetical protein [Vicinamibacterales bacterium]
PALSGATGHQPHAASSSSTLTIETRVIERADMSTFWSGLKTAPIVQKNRLKPIHLNRIHRNLMD